MKLSEIEHPKLLLLPDGRHELQEDFIYTWKHAGAILIVQVPPGYVTDLASVPRWLWWLIAHHELGFAAPLVHDFLYTHKGRVMGQEWSRWDVDRLFGRMMREEGVARWRRRMGFWAVHVFAWIFWKGKR